MPTYSYTEAEFNLNEHKPLEKETWNPKKKLDGYDRGKHQLDKYGKKTLHTTEKYGWTNLKEKIIPALQQKIVEEETQLEETDDRNNWFSSISDETKYLMYRKKYWENMLTDCQNKINVEGEHYKGGNKKKNKTRRPNQSKRRKTNNRKTRK